MFLQLTFFQSIICYNYQFVAGVLTYVTCSNKVSHMSANLNLKKTYKYHMMIFDDFDFLSPKYTLKSFLSIGNTYFSFIL